MEKLEEAYADSEIDDPVDPVPLNNPDLQISYLVKFVTYHRPGKRRGNRPPRAYPLPASRLAELATWWSRHRLEEFLLSQIGPRERSSAHISKHGILMVDFANRLQETRGHSRRSAIEEAAAVRLRPILMTTGAMVVGIIPLHPRLRRRRQRSRFAIGVTIFAGMAIGTLFALFVTPAVYTFLARDHAALMAREKALGHLAKDEDVEEAEAEAEKHARRPRSEARRRRASRVSRLVAGRRVAPGCLDLLQRAASRFGHGDI